ncbi:MAG TPA: erythromycin esterase family protein, partial [Symbiobacteriaceae bacterium]|nr:erythromycin esterase family protein [Symbiobacteriaceae bacterium]
ADPCAALVLTERDGVEWLKQRAVPLTNLEPLRATLAGVHTVALGEATHGSHEIFTVKADVVRYLVKDLGFTVLAMEAGYQQAFAVDEYLRTGKGDPGAALAGLGWWITNHEEILELLVWLRSYNETVPPERQVRFAGFDSQLVEPAAAWLLGQVPANPVLEGLAAGKYPESPDERRRWLSELEALAAGLSDARAAQGARVLAQFVDADLLSTSFREAVEKRERYLAENVVALRAMYAPESRMILWGGGSHFLDESPRAGRYLRQQFGAAYYALGVHFGQGGFRAIGAQKTVEAHSVGPVPAPNYLEANLACVRPGSFLADLRTGPRPAGAETWLGTARPARYISARYSPPEQGPVVLSSRPGALDGLIYIPVTTPSRQRP